MITRHSLAKKRQHTFTRVGSSSSCSGITVPEIKLFVPEKSSSSSCPLVEQFHDAAKQRMGDKGRIKKELTELQRDTKSGVTVIVKSGDLHELQGTITGPEGTPYEGGTYQISISIPGGYPFEPPVMKFLTKIWHPNISSQTGAICLDILKDQWSPALTIKTALLSLQALLCSPEPDDPQDAQVATMYLNDHAKFKQTATFWTDTYAKEHNDDSAALSRLVEMGFPRDQCIQALADAGGTHFLDLFLIHS